MLNLSNDTTFVCLLGLACGGSGLAVFLGIVIGEALAELYRPHP